MNVLDLFSGIGGFSLGLERAGMRTVAFCEIEPYCRAVLARHWPGVPCFGDITRLAVHDGWLVADADEGCGDAAEGAVCAGRPAIDACRVDVICGGFPCQDISAAGLGAGLAGARSGLWREYRRLIRELRPRYVVVENVAALLSRGLGEVLGDLASIGYDAEWHCIPASSIGAPHRRDRVWIVAYPECPEWRPQAAAWDHTHGHDAGGQEAPGWPAQRGANVADPARDMRTGPEETGAIRERARPRGQSIAARPDSERERLEGLEQGRPASGTVDRPCYGSDPSWWSVEPDVGRVVDGVSFEMDLARRLENAAGNDTQAIAKADKSIRLLLRAMWEHRALAATSPDAYRDRLRDCVPALPYGDSLSRWLLGPRIEADQGLRDLWEAVYSAPLYEAYNLQPELLERARAKKRPKTLGTRVDQLRALGNAIVPQIAEMIGKAIMSSERP